MKTESPENAADRLDRLEEAVAQLCQMEELEERIATRVVEKMQERPLEPGRSQGELVHEPAVQRAVPIPSAPHATQVEFSMPQLSMPPPVPESGLASVIRPLQASMPLAKSIADRVLPPSSLIRDLWWDIRTGYRMIRDPLYPMTFLGKVVPIVALLYMTVWPLFSSWTGIIGTVMNGLVYILVLYLAFKVIQRELRRYYEFAEKYQRP